MQEPAEAAPPPSEPANGAEAEPLADALGIELETARSLVAAGWTTPEGVRAASDDELRSAGVSEGDLERIRAAPIREPAPAPDSAPPADGGSPGSSTVIVEKWMRSVRQSERPRRRPRIPGNAPGSTEVLRKWVDGDDRAMETWIQSSEIARTIPSGPPGRSPPSAADSSGDRPGAGGGVPLAAGSAPGLLPANLVEREETVVRWLTELLDRVKTEQFNPTSVLQELQEHQRSLYDERERRRQVEEQLEQVKRGSVAVIKYVRSREEKARQELLEEKETEITELKGRLDQLIARVTAAQEGKLAAPSAADVETARADYDNRLQVELAGREAQFAEREGELKRRIVEVEGELRTIRMQAEATKTASTADPAHSGAAAKAQEEREQELIRRENELRTRFEEIRIRAEEIERKRDAIQFKEREFSGREQDIELRQRALEVETRRIEEAKKSLPAAALAGNPVAQAEQNRLDAIEENLARREKELMERETFLTRKLAEAEELQTKAVAVEAERLHAETMAEAKTDRLRTGVRRLDDLLFGGVPPGSQILINGPAHTGKDILARLFVAEALKTGQGALWVITDRTYTTVREEMLALYPPYADFEKRGLVRYVDLYSRSLGVTEAERGVKLLASNDKALLEQLTAAVNSFAGELKEKAPSYRMVFESVSTVTAYLDSTATFRFLQPLIGRRKIDRACAYYELETGMHSESDLQTLEHMMDGSIHLKVDQLKTFLSVRGITDVQSRAWVGYNFSKKAFTLGSFSLDHIR